MKTRIALTAFAVLFSFSTLSAQWTKPAPAEQIMKTAYKQAQDQQKNVFLIFHASWCGWCKKLEKALASEEIGKVFSDNYVITYMDVQERKGKIDSLENPGGNELMAKLGGEKSGLPFYVFLDAKGKTISTSNVMEKGANIGYPGSDEEIAAFTKLLKGSSKKIDDTQAAAVAEYLKKSMKK
jgi:thioredoxin-related protein